MALLCQDNEYIGVLLLELDDMKLLCKFIKDRTCPGWWNGIFAADTSIPLFQKPGFFGETFYDKISILNEFSSMHHGLQSSQSSHANLVGRPLS